MFKHIAWAMKAQMKDALARWLLVVLADHADDNNICWPSQKTLAERTGMSIATINRKMTYLEHHSLIKRISGEKGKSTTYKLLLSHGEIPISQSESTLLSQRETKLSDKLILSEEWQPSQKIIDKMDALASKHGVEINHDIETDKFISHHISVGTRFRDIEAGYRKWCANVITFATKQSTRTSNRPNKVGTHGQSRPRDWRRLIDSARN